eukprot:1713244-Rhodomonas_salina.1
MPWRKLQERRPTNTARNTSHENWYTIVNTSTAHPRASRQQTHVVRPGKPRCPRGGAWLAGRYARDCAGKGAGSAGG